MAVNFPAPGIYMDMPNDVYHATGALGSSNLKQLSWSPADFWYGSVHNPLAEEKESTAAQVIGSAFHKLILEGKDDFELAYACAHENGATRAGKAESAEIEAAGKIRIKFNDWARILQAGAAISANPFLASAFTGGPTEVSVFWNQPVDGSTTVPMKCRFDCLKLRSTTDLKTISPMDGLEFDMACKRQMGSYGYHVQAKHYANGRMQLAKLLADGAVYGDHDAALLKRVAEQPEFASVFIFLKKSGAPLTYGCQISPGNPVLDVAQATIDRAVSAYVANRDQFGFDTPWLVQKPLEELAAEELPPWSFR